MDYRFVGYTEDRKVVEGTILAATEESAREVLNRQGYVILSVKASRSFTFDWEKWFPSLFEVKPQAVVVFSRQLALLLEAGTDIVTCLELLQAQVSGRVFRRVLSEVILDLQAGSRLSLALGKHPKIFPSIYCRSLSVGEQTGGLDASLRQIADYMEKELVTRKGLKSALAYPLMVSGVAFVVVLVLVTFVLPAFTDLYGQMGAELPLITRMLLASVNGLRSFGLYFLLLVAIAVLASVFYVRTPSGKLAWDRLAFRLPLVGWLNRLAELARCCRSMAVLFRSGLPLTEIMSMLIAGCANQAMKQALIEVQQAMLKGEGLSQPMSKNPLFLPMMVQMVRVGEETGNMDITLLSVAQTYEAEADEKTRALIGFIQPAMTLGIGIVVAFIAISLLSAMYAVYGQMG